MAVTEIVPFANQTFAMRGRKFRRFCALLTGASLLLLLLGVITEKWRGRSRLHHIHQQLTSEGVSLNIKTAFERDVPDAANGAFGLSELSKFLRENELPVKFPPRGMIVESPGFARSGIDGEVWEDAAGKTYSWNQLEDSRNHIENLMKRISDAADKPRFASPLDPSKGVVDMKLDSLQVMPLVVRTCNIKAMQALRDGDDLRAIQAVTTLLNFYCDKAEDPIIIAQMVRWSQCRVAYGLTWELLQHATADDQSWLRLQQSWAQCHFVKDCIKAWEVELASIDYSYSLLEGSSSYRRHVIELYESMESNLGLAWNPPARGWPLKSIVLPAWRLLWADQDNARALEDTAIDWNLARMAQTNTWRATTRAAQQAGRHTEAAATGYMAQSNLEPGYYDRCRYLFQTGPTLVLGSYVHRMLRAQTEANIAATVIALNRYKISRGSYPGTLAKLVPDLLPGIPVDPFDHKPLRYRLTNARGFLLYSVGSNGLDDGGSNELTNAKTNSVADGWSALDFVWPKSVTTR